MNILKSIIVALPLGLFVLIAVPSPTSASPECDVNPAVEGVSLTDLKNKSIVLNGNSVDVSVTVSGNDDCEKTVSVASWKFPNPTGLPLKEQKLFKTSTQTFGLGTHVINVEVPDCYWQVDLVEGDRPTAADGTADYQLGEPNDETDRLMDAAFGGDKECFPTDTPVTGPVTPVPIATSPVTIIPETGNSTPMTIAIFAGLGALVAAGIYLRRAHAKK